MGFVSLGRLAAPTLAITTDFVEFEIKRAFEWLQGDRIENRRLSAILVLKELSIQAPNTISQHLNQIFDLIWVGLRDSKVFHRFSFVSGVYCALVLFIDKILYDVVATLLSRVAKYSRVLI